jgi:hypothetical protein
MPRNDVNDGFRLTTTPEECLAALSRASGTGFLFVSTSSPICITIIQSKAKVYKSSLLIKKIIEKGEELMNNSYTK